MSKERITVTQLPLVDPTPQPGRQKVLKVEVYYTKGGYSFTTYKQVQRGIFLSMRPVTLDGCFESWACFSGAHMFLEEAKRFNARRLQEWAAAVQNDPRYQQLLDHVLAKEQIQLEPAAAQVAAA